ncbi:MAG: hypothetical protein J1F17_07245 [Oscillospiraceae bacterium]|nr:hypothetical protein [Oscillospiraceae bacterium]
MRLYLKRDTSHCDARFIILNEQGYERFYAVNSANHKYGRINITDLGFNKLCSISTIPLPLFKAYTICDNKDTIRLVFSKNTVRPVCYYYGISWRITGDFLGKNYEIVDHDNKVLLSHYNTHSRISDGYELVIYDENRLLLLLSSVICIDSIEITNSKQFQTV